MYSNIDRGLGKCGMLRECKNLVGGIALGDLKSIGAHAALYLLPVGNMSSVKI